MVAPETPDAKILTELRNVSGQMASLPARRAELFVAARQLDPPIQTARLAEAAGVTLGAITQSLRKSEAELGLPKGALSSERAPRRPASAGS